MLVLHHIHQVQSFQTMEEIPKGHYLRKDGLNYA